MWSHKFGLLLILAGLWSLPDAVVENEKLFEAMAPDAQREMVRKWERFSTLSAADQERWRAFDAQLAAHPDAEQLRSVMDQYYEWNLALSDRDRATLSSDSVDKRMELVQKLRLQQYERNLLEDESTRLTLDELEVFQQWGREFQQWRREAIQSQARREPLTGAELDAKLDDLQRRFSGRVAALMAERKGKLVEGRDERWLLVDSWTRALMRPSSAMLKSVYESLTPEEKVALSELPEMTPDSIEAKLREYYFDRIDLGEWARRVRGRGPGGPSGRGPGGPGPVGPGFGGPVGADDRSRPRDSRTDGPLPSTEQPKREPDSN